MKQLILMEFELIPAKACLHCNAPVMRRRRDAKYCCDTCKAKAWEERKAKEAEKKEQEITKAHTWAAAKKENWLKRIIKKLW
jgi:hypothetical protein